VIKLKPGWWFDASSGSFRHDDAFWHPVLPAGARLVAAITVTPPAPPRRPTPVERELARFVDVRAADDDVVDRALAVVRRWSFVECADAEVEPPAFALH
jgi:hypothetical protein